MQTAYVPIGVPTFDLECAQKEFEASVRLIREIDSGAVCPEEMLLSMDKLDAFLDILDPDFLIIQNITFANSAYCAEIISRFPDCPVLLWTLFEPVVDGGRLRLNSLTGAYSAANCMKSMGREDFGYVLGSVESSDTRKAISSSMKAAALKKHLRTVTMASVGHTPQGFGFGRALDSEMRRFFGVNLISIEARELMEKALSYDVNDCTEYRKYFEERCVSYDSIPNERLEAFFRLFKAYDEFVKTNRVQILSSRCWPDFFTSYGTPVCAVLSLLNDKGISAACESDAFGALSMYVSSFFTGSPVFFGDPVSIDEEKNTLTYWHCGMAPTSLACSPCIGVHPNRKIGPVMDFACRGDEKVTIFRIGRNPDATFRVFVSTGTSVSTQKQFIGTSVVVKTDGVAKDIIRGSVTAGWEPHFVVAYGDIRKELVEWARMMGLPIEEY